MAHSPTTLPRTTTLRRGRAFVTFGGCLLAMTTILHAETVYVAETMPLAGDCGGPARAILQPAAEAEVTETIGACSHVVLRGWAREGAERALFALPGKRILVAAVKPDATGALRRLGSKEDLDTGITWQEFEIDGWVEATGTAPELGPIWAEAWELFATRCTACHVRRIPAHYTADQWRSHLKVMGPRTGLPPEEQARILAFLQHHASDTIEAEIAAGTAFPQATRR